MQSWKKYIAAYFLLPMVLMASTGLSLHSIYCLCKGEHITSLAPPAKNGCTHEPGDANKLAPKSCCKLGQVPHQQPASSTASYEADCCTQENVIFLKATTESFSAGSCFVAAAVFIQPPASTPLGIDRVVDVAYRHHQPPPRPGGRQWLALGQSLRC